MYVDFHTHTLASDGKLTPTQLVKKTKKLGILYLAKTDHDNVDLMDEFMQAGKKYGVHTIPGIEISSKYKGKSAHIVGLGIDWNDKEIRKYAKKCKVARKQRGLKMAEKLAGLGFEIKQSEIDRNVITRPHVANAVINHKLNKKRLLDEFGKIPNFSEFIQKYLAKEASCFVSKTFYMPAKPAIKMIHEANGLAIIGHPCSKTKEFSYSPKHLLKLIKLKFDGIEVYNPDATLVEIKYLKNLAKKYNLLISAGTDYHGIDTEFKLGRSNAGKYVREEMCGELVDSLMR